MALKSIMLIILAIVAMVVPGMLYNNLNNNGLAVSQSQALTCSSDSQTPTCFISGNVGCQANSAYCTLSGSSISFLSHTSIFTAMIQGNVFALFTGVNGPSISGGGAQSSWSGTHGPFDLTGNPVYYSADCQGTPVGDKSQIHWGLGRCTQTTTDGSNITEANVATWNNWNINWNTTVALQFYRLGNATYTRSCTWIAQVNYTALANGPGFTYFGCTINAATSIQGPPTTQPTHRSWAYLVAMPVSYGAMPAGTSHQQLFVQLENWFTQGCVPNLRLAWYASNACTNFLGGFNGVNIPGTNITFVPNSGLAVVFALLAGVALFILGLGLSVGVGGGVSIGANEQGTKLFQAVGIGLIIWTPLYSEFSTWFTTGLLPYGLDGTVGIMSLLLTGMFFFGVAWRAWSRD